MSLRRVFLSAAVAAAALTLAGCADDHPAASYATVDTSGFASDEAAYLRALQAGGIISVDTDRDTLGRAVQSGHFVCQAEQQTAERAARRCRAVLHGRRGQ